VTLKVIMHPPHEIDGARVIEWAWSGVVSFGEVSGASTAEVFGLAIVTYDDVKFYRFSCDNKLRHDFLINTVT